jgi:hypothetical protein
MIVTNHNKKEELYFVRCYARVVKIYRRFRGIFSRLIQLLFNLEH